VSVELKNKLFSLTTQNSNLKTQSSGCEAARYSSSSKVLLKIVFFYNGQRGGGSRWEFYIFYIGHMALLYGLRLVLWGY